MTAKGITLDEPKHAFTFVISEDSDGAGYLSRDTYVAEGGMGGVEFVVGEIFAVVNGVAVKLDLAGEDGSEVFAGIAGYRVKLPAGGTTTFSAINAHATVRGSDLTYPDGSNDADKAAINAAMLTKLIKVR